MASVFRSAANSTARRFSGIIAASLMAASQAVTPLPATARDIEGLPPQCAKVGDELAKLKCGRAVFQGQIADAKARSADAKARSADAKARGAAADARAKAAEKQTSAADASTQCMERVAQEAGDPKKLSAEQKAAVRAKILACG